MILQSCQGLGIWEWIDWVVRAQGLSEGCSQNIARAAVTWRFDWGGRVHFHGDSEDCHMLVVGRRPQFLTMWTSP